MSKNSFNVGKLEKLILDADPDPSQNLNNSCLSLYQVSQKSVPNIPSNRVNRQNKPTTVKTLPL